MNQRKFIYNVFQVNQGFGFDVHFLNSFVSEDLAQKYVKQLSHNNALSPIYRSSVRKSVTYFIDKVVLVSDLSTLGIFFDESIV